MLLGVMKALLGVGKVSLDCLWTVNVVIRTVNIVNKTINVVNETVY